MKIKLVPIKEHVWSDDFSYHRILTCINHQDARYSTKNPFTRSIFFQKAPEGNFPRRLNGECKCAIEDLAVLVYEETGKEV